VYCAGHRYASLFCRRTYLPSNFLWTFRNASCGRFSMGRIVLQSDRALCFQEELDEGSGHEVADEQGAEQTGDEDEE